MIKLPLSLPTNRRHNRRAGISRTEVVVVVLCIGLLVSLLIPWLLQFRSGPVGPRQQQCLVNMRDVGLAMEAYLESHGTEFPPLEDGEFGWTVALLPYLKQEQLAQDMRSASSDESSAVRLPVFVCPEDLTIDEFVPANSYVVNGGYVLFELAETSPRNADFDAHSLEYDLDGNTRVSEHERDITQATGVLWRTQRASRRIRLAQIRDADGLEPTLLLSENVDAQRWDTTHTLDLAFVLNRKSMTFPHGVTGSRALALGVFDPEPFAICTGGVEGEWRWPRPSSWHDGYVNVIYCDGRGASLSDEIDPIVYAQLMTWNGGAFGEYEEEPGALNGK